MAFETTGSFTTTGTQPLQDLLRVAKIKKTQPAAATPPNVYTAPQDTFTSTRAVAPTELQPKIPEADTVTKSSSSPPEPPPGVTPEIHYISDDPESPYYWQTLGLPDSTWSGLPYEMGWWEQDAEGNPVTWVQQRDMLPVAQQLYDLQNLEVPEAPELQDITQTSAMQGIEDLVALWNDPNTAIADRESAVTQAAAEMGMTYDELANMLGSMVGQANLGVQGQQGLSQQYNDTYNRETALELQDMRENYRMLMESMGVAGRNVAGYQAMDEIARSLSSYQLQRDITRMNLDMATKQSEYDALLDRWDTLYRQKEMTAQEVMNNIQENRQNALTGYAQELAAYISQNQLELQAYQADLQAVQLHAEITYQGIMADMGVSEGMMSQMQDWYEMHMAPYYAELEKWSLEQQAEATQQAQNAQTVGTFLSGVGVLCMVAMASLICTELFWRGYMDEETYMADSEFGKIVREKNPSVFYGYLKFARRVVNLMRKSELFTKIVNVFVQRWSKEMLYRLGKRKRGNWLGKLMMDIGMPLCALVGRNYGVVGRS